MVPVKKPIIAAKAPEATEPQKRRPRNTGLNSSKQKTGQQALAELRKQKLNCSAGRIPDELKPYYQEITQDEFAKIVGADPDALSGIISDIENEYGEKIVGYVTCKPEYEAAFLEANIDAGFITESGKVLNGVDDGYINGSEVNYAASQVDDPDLSSSTDQSMNCSETAEGDETETGTVTLYNDFADLKVDEVEKLVKDRVQEMAPECEVSVEKLSDTELKVTLTGTDECITRGRLAVESSDVTKSVDWSTKLDSGCHGEDKLNSSEDEVVTITTESGNEVSLSDIKIVQNPDTNELALYVPENEDDEIPEGFVVIATAAQDALPAAEENPETGDDENLNSSRKTAVPMNRAQRRHPNHRKLNSAKRRRK